LKQKIEQLEVVSQESQQVDKLVEEHELVLQQMRQLQNQYVQLEQDAKAYRDQLNVFKQENELLRNQLSAHTTSLRVVQSKVPDNASVRSGYSSLTSSTQIAALKHKYKINGATPTKMPITRERTPDRN
jgi:chromosome segregation ATPase